MLKTLLILSTMMMQGCLYSVHQYHMGDFGSKPKKGNSTIRAQAERTVILGLSGDTSYVNRAYENLQSKCRGKIVSIATKHTSDLLFFHHKDRIELTGVCIK